MGVNLDDPGPAHPTRTPARRRGHPPIGGGHRLRADAVAALPRMDAERPLCLTDFWNALQTRAPPAWSTRRGCSRHLRDGADSRDRPALATQAAPCSVEHPPSRRMAQALRRPDVMSGAPASAVRAGQEVADVLTGADVDAVGFR